MPRTSKQLAETKKLMGALVRMKPKPHKKMKTGASPKTQKNVAKK
jgi:hypothetical protein